MHLAGSIYHKSGSHWEHNMQGARNLDSSPPSRHQACYQLANYLLCGSSYIDLNTWFFSLCSATQSVNEDQGE